MMELVDILGLGSSFFYKSKGSSPFFGKAIKTNDNYKSIMPSKKKKKVST